MHTKIQPGAYRPLFLDALAKYRETAHPDEFACIDHYAKLLRDPAQKFGSFTNHGNPGFVPGELFLKS